MCLKNNYVVMLLKSIDLSKYRYQNFCGINKFKMSFKINKLYFKIYNNVSNCEMFLIIIHKFFF